MENFHTPVMLNEVIDSLNIQPGKWYIDCNLGGGGHTSAILAQGGRVLGIDVDSDATRQVAKKFNLEEVEQQGIKYYKNENFMIVQSNFAKLDEIVERFSLKQIGGILFDLGVSSYQFDTGGRGFSFSKDAPLDMRMSKELGVTAADLVNALGDKELADLFFKYGEEPLSRVYAKKIIESRKANKIETTSNLVNIILSVKKPQRGKIHPATQVFQALRIVVNNELNSLEQALPKAIRLMSTQGRLVVISFHSLEDRIVKNIFKEFENKGGVKIITKSPLGPSPEETEINPRSRSAKLRILEKL